MRFNALTYLSVLLISAASSLAMASINIDLKALANRAEQIASNQFLTAESCATELSQYYNDLVKINPSEVDLLQTKDDFKDLTMSLFYIRLELRNRLKDIANSENKTSSSVQQCATAMRNVFRLHRFLEDYLGELILAPKRYVDKKDPKTIDPLSGDAPNTMMAPNIEKWTVRSGDIIISRGNAFTSAAIARIGQVDAQFSHLALIYVMGSDSQKEFSVEEAVANPNVLVLEAHIEIGSTIRTFAEYLNDGNARAALFRYPDASIAHEAARNSYSQIKDYQLRSQKLHPKWEANDPTHNLPYDFKMSLKDDQELFCSEVGYFGFKKVGVEMPLFTTKVVKDNDFISRLGITESELFAPGDMELETRFEYLGEYRDYRKLSNIRLKDAVLTSMFAWLENHSYQIKPSLNFQAKAMIAWITRHLNFEFTKEKLPKNMRMKVLSTVFVLDKVGTILQDSLTQEEARYFKASGRLMTLPMMMSFLENIRQVDAEKYRTNQSSLFHSLLRPDNLVPEQRQQY